MDKFVITQCQRRIDRTDSDKEYHFPQHTCGTPVLVRDANDILESAMCGPCLLELPEMVHAHSNFVHNHSSQNMWHNKDHCWDGCNVSDVRLTNTNMINNDHDHEECWFCINNQPHGTYTCPNSGLDGYSKSGLIRELAKERGLSVVDVEMPERRIYGSPESQE